MNAKSDESEELDDLMTAILKISGLLEPLQYALARQIRMSAYLNIRRTLLDISFFTYTIVKISQDGTLEDFMMTSKGLEDSMESITNLIGALKEIVIERQKEKVKH